MTTPSPLSAAALEAALLGENAEARASFRKKHESRLRGVLRACQGAYGLLWPLYQLPNGDSRSNHATAFLHMAFNSVLTSTNLLVAGYPLPAGNQMRHAAEAVAMALLMCDDQSHVFEEFSERTIKFPVDAAPSRLMQRRQWERLVRLFDLQEDGQEHLIDLQRFYSDFSHAGALALAYHLHFGVEGAVIIGAEHDAEKDKVIPIELSARVTAFETIGELGQRVEKLLSASGKGPGTATSA